MTGQLHFVQGPDWFSIYLLLKCDLLWNSHGFAIRPAPTAANSMVAGQTPKMPCKQQQKITTPSRTSYITCLLKDLYWISDLICFTLIYVVTYLEVGAAELRSLGQTRFGGGVDLHVSKLPHLDRRRHRSNSLNCFSDTGQTCPVWVGWLHASLWKKHYLQPLCIGAFNIWRVCNPLYI